MKVNVSITPSGNPVIVGVNLTQQFTASVSGISNQAVTWSVSGASTLSGMFTGDGSSSITGIEDQTTPSGNTSNQAFAATYTVASNGRGTISVTAPAAISRVLYVLNGSKFVTIDTLVQTRTRP
jgi:hypothetical protein